MVLRHLKLKPIKTFVDKQLKIKKKMQFKLLKHRKIIKNKTYLALDLRSHIFFGRILLQN